MTDKLTGLAELGDVLGEHSRIAFVARQIMNGMATATLVQVKAVNTGAETVDVQPLVMQIDGAGQTIPHGTINALPFFAMRAGASAVKLVPKVGDIGVAIFCHSDISAVKANKKAAQPGSRRRYSWSDGLYFGGFLGPTPTTIISLDDATGVTITVPSGKTITMNGNVTVNGTLTATTDVVGGGKSLKNHTHSGVQTGSGTSGPPS